MKNYSNSNATIQRQILWKLQNNLRKIHRNTAYNYSKNHDWSALIEQLGLWRENYPKYSTLLEDIKNIFISSQQTLPLPKYNLLSRMDCENLISTPLPDYFPLALQYEGNPEILRQPKVGIVGSRHPTLYGREQCYFFSRALSQVGVTVISGGAIGIDTIANAAAIGGFSCAVLGSGLNNLYPPSNLQLFEKIKNSGGGLLISQFEETVSPSKGNFPKRNVTLAGLCDFLLVVEATRTSGSLITAQACLEMGRDVGALPGAIDAVNSEGTNWLIQNGAFCIQKPSDVLERVLRLKA